MLYDRISRKIQNNVRAALLDWPMDFGLETAVMNGVDGDYHEFGVFEGRSFIRNAKHFARLLGPEKAAKMKFWAYDSFEGLPETKDRYAPAHFYKGSFSAPRELFMKNVTSAGIKESSVKIVPGFYDQSLTPQLAAETFKDRKVAMTYIDCDIYESTVPIFKYLTPGLQVGSVIVIDDWVRHHAHPRHGMQRAFNEWIEVNPTIKVMQLALSKRVAFVVYQV